MYLIITYGFPVILILFELGIRAVIKIDTSDFIGPALASAALCFLAPLTKPKEISGLQLEGTSGHITIKKVDSNFIGFTWLMIMGALGAWGACCVIANKNPGDHSYLVYNYGVGLPLIVGIIAYLVSLIMTVVKERI
ncbi:hypothetical protein [Pseudomonas brassicacearum]|uniref:hypothetical protein n=1 Tax=Pseudomonas brassicacearum TaxID=930166 RepID=UPI0005765249|nr:hypothetical protein [Pseudomonas brassicacearum]ROM90618.1 hypothetical protein BK656_23990 [Pseudomonas brassicacearum]